MTATETIARESFTPAIFPHVYMVLWQLALYGPLVASEMADYHNLSARNDRDRWTGRDVSNRLRGVQKLGLVARDDDGFWLLTGRGHRLMMGEVAPQETYTNAARLFALKTMLRHIAPDVRARIAKHTREIAAGEPKLRAEAADLIETGGRGKL